MTDDVLQRLAALISARRTESASKSYTRELLDGGPETLRQEAGRGGDRDHHRRAGPGQSRPDAGGGRPRLSPAGAAREQARAARRRAGRARDRAWAPRASPRRQRGKRSRNEPARSTGQRGARAAGGRPGALANPVLALSRVQPRGVGQAARRHADDAGAARPGAALRPDRGAVDGGGGADLPADVAAAQPARRRRPGAARGDEPLPRPHATAACPTSWASPDRWPSARARPPAC